jgi:thiol-disulfide isomerase/thioredoxin
MDDFDPYKIIFVQDSLYLLLDEALPDFQLRDSNDKIFSSDKLMGRPTLINFWTTSNGYEIPQLNLLKKEYGESVNFIAIIDMHAMKM